MNKVILYFPIYFPPWIVSVAKIQFNAISKLVSAGTIHGNVGTIHRNEVTKIEKCVD